MNIITITRVLHVMYLLYIVMVLQAANAGKILIGPTTILGTAQNAGDTVIPDVAENFALRHITVVDTVTGRSLVLKLNISHHAYVTKLDI